MKNEDSAFGPGMMFGIPGSRPKKDRKPIPSDPKKEKGKSVKNKRFLTYENFIVENIINEIGDAGIPPYQWNLSMVDGNLESYEFDVEGTSYQVDLSPFKNGVNVSFSANGDSQITTNQGKQFKIMSTIIDIVKQRLKKYPETNKISFVPHEDFSNDMRRFKLYVAYLERNFNVIDTKIEHFKNTKTIEITIKK